MPEILDAHKCTTMQNAEEILADIKRAQILSITTINSLITG